MKKVFIFGLSALGLILLGLGGYETVKSLSSIQYYDIIREVKRKWGLEEVPDGLTLATIETESSFNPEAVRYEAHINDSSVGLMQTLYTTAQGLGYTGDLEGLKNPAESIRWGTAYHLQLYKKYRDWDAVIHAYNEGPGNYDRGRRVPTYYGRIMVRWVKWDGLLASGGEGVTG